MRGPSRPWSRIATSGTESGGQLPCDRSRGATRQFRSHSGCRIHTNPQQGLKYRSRDPGLWCSLCCRRARECDFCGLGALVPAPSGPSMSPSRWSPARLLRPEHDAHQPTPTLSSRERDGREWSRNVTQTSDAKKETNSDRKRGGQLKSLAMPVTTGDSSPQPSASKLRRKRPSAA